MESRAATCLNCSGLASKQRMGVYLARINKSVKLAKHLNVIKAPSSTFYGI